MRKYYEITRDGLSSCINSDTGYCYNFKISDVLCLSGEKLNYIKSSGTLWSIGHVVSFFSGKKLTIDECIYDFYLTKIELNDIKSISKVE